MNKVTTLLASTLLMTLVAGCSAGGSPGSRPSTNPSATSGSQATTAATSAPALAMPTATGGAMAGMDHGGMSAPFDAMFIDGMIMHHQGAIEMAKEAQTKATKPEIKTLAAAIIKAQEAEIKQMKAWRQEWYADLKDTGGMQMDMGAMTVKDGAEPYDVRFIAAMIPHHESAITMSQQALQRSEHAELKTLAGDIIKAQTSEIAQMKQWYEAWTGKPFAVQ